MPAIVEFPTIVQKAVEQYKDFFRNEPERKHFGEYLTGLYIAEKKTVSGINSEFAATTDQSCLNRWLTQAPWDAEKLYEERLKDIQQDPQMRYSEEGTIPLDNTLIDHDGKFIEDVGYFWDHADKRHLIAHDYLIANYVCPSGKHYALAFRCFRKKEDCQLYREYLEKQPGGISAASAQEQRRATFRSHTDLCKELVDWVIARQIPGNFTFDSYFTNAPTLNHVEGKKRNYVGDLKFNRKVWFQGKEMRASDLATLIDSESRKAVVIGDDKQWYFTKTIHIPDVEHPVRIVILWERKNASEAKKILVTNRTNWEVNRILRVYRQRWTGTETFHRDGKQHLGMGDCQLRKGEGQTRHMYLVMLAHNLLMSEMNRSSLSDWAKSTLSTIGEACRAMLRETLGKTISWVIDKATNELWNLNQIKAHLALV
jgi:hypothetical protein